ncbi:MAG: hypothetical protein MJE68_01100, partial [Proteobacteria bacterium]|nr:hypothetical protein [Pseudomonadota bacterium]
MLSSGGSTRSFTIQLLTKEYALCNMHIIMHSILAQNYGTETTLYVINLLQIFKDWHLMLFILVLAGITIFLLLLGTAIPHLRGTATEIRDIESPNGLSV